MVPVLPEYMANMTAVQLRHLGHKCANTDVRHYLSLIFYCLSLVFHCISLPFK